MEIAWGVVVVVLALIGWGGQAISWLAPDTAVNLQLAEAEDDVEPVFFADARGEAMWDTLTLWTMLVAGVLLILDEPAWAYFGLVGGGMYVYFSGRGILTRRSLVRRGFRVGTAQNTRLGFVALAVWGGMGLITIGAAVASMIAS